jgi:hypothetical protein
VYIKNEKTTAAFRILLVIACAWGIALNIAIPINSVWDMLSYYTIQSNLLALIFFLILLYRTRFPKSGQAAKRPPVLFPSVKGAVTLTVAITFLVFHFALRPTMFSMGGYTSSAANALVHYAVPLAVLADWLLFSPKGLWKKTDPLKWLAVPLAYFLFALIRAQVAVFGGGNRYPYFFIDIDLYGIAPVLRNVLFLALGFAALGYILFLADLALAKIAAKRPN